MNEITEQVLNAVEHLEDTTIDNGTFQRCIWVRPEFDCWDRCAHGDPRCRRDTGYWHGVGSRRLLIGVKVPDLGGVAFELFTPIYTERVTERIDDLLHDYEPLGSVDLHHAKPPQHLEWFGHVSDCKVTGGDCWVGHGTTQQTHIGVKTLLERGPEGVWAWLGEAWLPRLMEDA